MPLLTPQFLADMLMLATLRGLKLCRDVHVEVVVMETVVGNMFLSDLDDDDIDNVDVQDRISSPE